LISDLLLLFPIARVEEEEVEEEEVKEGNKG